MTRRIVSGISGLLIWLSAVSAYGTPLTLKWQDLVPTKGEGVPLFVDSDQKIHGLPDRTTFEGSEEDFAYLVDSMETLKYQQPPGAYIKPELDGKTVRIPGYITPLSFDGVKLTEFLLVPYHGACIHRPPPPGNQIVYVSNATGVVIERLYQPVWITGKIRAKSVGTAVADVGYSIDGAVTEPYDSVKEQYQ